MPCAQKDVLTILSVIAACLHHDRARSSTCLDLSGDQSVFSSGALAAKHRRGGGKALGDQSASAAFSPSTSTTWLADFPEIRAGCKSGRMVWERGALYLRAITSHGLKLFAAHRFPLGVIAIYACEQLCHWHQGNPILTCVGRVHLRVLLAVWRQFAQIAA